MMLQRLVYFFALVLLNARWCFALPAECTRLVSLAPSITETIFALGLGDRLAGVTRYCKYPPEAQKIDKIGGFYDTNLERIVSLKPSLVVGLSESEETNRSLQRLNIATLQVDHTTVSGIKMSLNLIAQRCGVVEQSEKLLAQFAAREHELQARASRDQGARVLVVVGRNNQGAQATSLYLSGKDGFYSGILEILGMRNANVNATIAMPVISPEGLMALAPEVVIEVLPNDEATSVNQVMEWWGKLNTLPAVRQGRVFILTQDYAAIPGPRYLLLAEEIVRHISGAEHL